MKLTCSAVQVSKPLALHVNAETQRSGLSSQPCAWALGLPVQPLHQWRHTVDLYFHTWPTCARLCLHQSPNSHCTRLLLLHTPAQVEWSKWGADDDGTLDELEENCSADNPSLTAIRQLAIQTADRATGYPKLIKLRPYSTLPDYVEACNKSGRPLPQVSVARAAA